MDVPILVASTLDAEGERFVVIDATQSPPFGGFLSNLPRSGSLAERRERLQKAWRDYVEARPSLTEEEARQQLAQHGLQQIDIERRIVKARRFREWAPLMMWESTTEIGYRNADGQVVVGRTDRPGTAPFQRVFHLRCDDCGHEYGANGCDIHARRCPSCQDGAPGLPTSIDG